MRWLTRTLADVPADDGWLTARERAVLATLKLPPRRESWRLGRWTAKALLGPDAEIVAAADGAPEVTGSTVSLSLSHRAGRGLAVASADCVAGCDIELIEPRSPGFVADWLSPPEQEAVAGLTGEALALAVNLRWTGKEAAAKVRREGLRLDVRDAVVTPSGDGSGWSRLEVAWGTERLNGWWLREEDFVLAVVTDPAAPAPER
jgi:4'-phosphopantetheinyl transferase